MRDSSHECCCCDAFTYCNGIYSFSSHCFCERHPRAKLSDILITLFSLTFCGWLSVTILNIVFRPKMILYENYIEIHHWKNGSPYTTIRTMKIPKITKTIIKYSELSLFGGYFLKDVAKYLEENSGFLEDIRISGTKIPIQVKLLRGVLLFVKSDGDGLVVEGKPYGLKQVQFLLYELEQRTHIQASGRVQAKKHLNSVVLIAISGLGVICGLTGWLLIIPVATIWLEGFFNPAHIPAFESPLRSIYVISIFFANFCIAGYYIIRKDKVNADFENIANIFKLIAFVLYFLFFVAFILSILN